ncbi:hypothetical protein EJB05_00534, partial [Eragrostis curvula]
MEARLERKKAELESQKADLEREKAERKLVQELVEEAGVHETSVEYYAVSHICQKQEKWRILKNVPSFPLFKQSHIIVACMALHNFIRDSAMDDQDFARYDQDDEYVPQEVEVDEQMTVNEETEHEANMMEDRNMNAFRDQLAYALYHRGLNIWSKILGPKAKEHCLGRSTRSRGSSWDSAARYLVQLRAWRDAEPSKK